MWSTFCTGSALADPVSVFKGSGFSGFSEKGTHDSGWGPSADRYQIQPLFLRQEYQRIKERGCSMEARRKRERERKYRREEC